MKHETIDYYIASFEKEVQEKLEKIRSLLHEVIPDGKEKISYGIPTIYIDRHIIHFAAFKNHIGLYPGPQAIDFFAEQLTSYHCSKGAVQFPFEKELPVALIKKIAKYCVTQRKNT